MFATTLIHIAIWTQLAASHAVSYIELHATRPAPVAFEEKVVIRETTMSEKCALGVESVTRPDAEIAALQADATKFTSGIDLRANAKGPSWETPNLHKVYWATPNWNEKFAFSWDDDGGFYFGGQHICKEPENPDAALVGSFFCPGFNH